MIEPWNSMGALSSTSIIGSRIASLPAIYAPNVTNQAHHHKKLNYTYPFELMGKHNYDVHFNMTHDQKKIKIGPKPNTSKDISYELSSKHSSSKPCAHTYIVTRTSNQFVSICVFVCMCLSRVLVSWLFVLLTNRWLCLFSLVKFQTRKSHPTTTTWKHRDAKKDRDREIEKTNILWMFVFVFSASFVLVECTSLLEEHGTSVLRHHVQKRV
jgi:hypothetical protein